MNENTSGALTTAVEKLPAAEAVSVARTATIAEMKEQYNLIKGCLGDLMKEETHYGKLPGCGDKKVLLKPGAEFILALFHIAAEPTIEEFTDGFDIRFRVTVQGIHTPSGKTVGYGIGEASTSEKKYKWREAVCHEEWEQTPETRRQKAWIRDYKTKQPKPVEQVRQNPADLTNTVLKMAKKRAVVDLCLSTTACSDIFVQDMDDPDINDAVNQGENASKQQQGSRYTAPQRRSQGAAPAPAQGQSAPPSDVISDAQRKRLYAIGKGRNLSDDEMGFLVYDVAHVNRSDEIPRKLYDAVVAEFEKATPGNVIPMDEGN